MKYALYLGCAIPVKALKYEISARTIAPILGIELVDLKGFGCCGFPVKSMDHQTALYMAARNLSLAEAEELGIIGLCSGCVAMLSEAIIELQDEKARDSVNKRLKSEGLKAYNGKVSVKHMARLLSEHEYLHRIEAAIQKPLSKMNIAIHYGCHYIKPSHAHGGFDDPNHPGSLGRIIRALGAPEVDYPMKGKCCGLTMMAADEAIAYQLAGSKLKAICDRKADALMLACPSCCVSFENNQKVAAKAVKADLSLPVLYYTQIIGMAMDRAEKDLGFEFNRIPIAYNT